MKKLYSLLLLMLFCPIVAIGQIEILPIPVTQAISSMQSLTLVSGTGDTLQLTMHQDSLYAIVLYDDGVKVATLDTLGAIQSDKVQAISSAGLSLFEGGGSGIFVEDGGKVGVNTTSPGKLLDVNGSAIIRSGNILYLGAARLYESTDLYIRSGTSITNYQGSGGGAGNHNFNSGQAYFKSDGKVGINTTVPSHPLTVANVSGLLVTGEAVPAGTDSCVVAEVSSGDGRLKIYADDGDYATLKHSGVSTTLFTSIGSIIFDATNRLNWSGTALYPDDDNMRDVGTAAKRFNDGFFGSDLGVSTEKTIAYIDSSLKLHVQSGHGTITFTTSNSNNCYMQMNLSDYLTVTNAAAFSVGGNLLASGNLNVDGFVNGSTTSGITAVNPGGQGDGALTTEINEVSTVGAGDDAVTLPTAAIGRKVMIINNGANQLEIWPASGDDAGGGANTAITLAAGSNLHLVAYNVTNWEVM